MWTSVVIVLTILPLAVTTQPINPSEGLPIPDCYLHLYALPVGNGEANIIQCPVTGDLTIIDMGSVSRNGPTGSQLFWDDDKVKDWLGDNLSKVKNIIISHKHTDEGNYLDDVLPADQIPGANVYISCLKEDMTSSLNSWKESLNIIEIGTASASATPCNAEGDPCNPGSIQICNNYYLDILAANLGGCGSSPDKDSVVARLRQTNGCESGNVTVLFTGDLEGSGLNALKTAFANNPEAIKSTIYELGRHGTEEANDVDFVNTVSPEAIYVNSNPWRSGWNHPHCETTTDSDSDPSKTFQLTNTAYGQDHYFCSTASSRASSDPVLQLGTNGKAIHTTVSGNIWDPTLNVIEFVIKKAGRAWESHSWPVST